MPRSLYSRSLVQLSVGFGLVALMIVASTYWYVRSVLTEDAIATLTEYVKQRGERESQIFLQAQRNLAFLAEEFRAALRRPVPADTDQVFDRLFARSPDGAYRRRPETLRLDEEANSFLSVRTPLTAEVKRRLIATHRLATVHGRAWGDTFSATYIGSLEGLFSSYWPGIDRARDVPPDADLSARAWIALAGPEHNPTRSPVWTGLWHDPETGSWFVSCVLPIDERGEYRYYAGTALALEQILDRTQEVKLKGTYNMILRADGRIISHPDYDDAIKQSNGLLNLNDLADAHLKEVYRRVLESGGRNVIELAGFGDYIGVARIAGPEWYFVTVFPKALAVGAIARAQTWDLTGSAATVFAALLAFAWVIRRQITRRLDALARASDQIARGRRDISVPEEGQDEITRLAHSFNVMASTIGERDARLGRYAADLENAVAQRTAELEQARAAADSANRAKTRLLAAASHDLRQPTYALGLLVDTLDNLLRRQPLPKKEIGEVTARIKSTHEGLNQLLNSILDFSKLDTGATAVQIQPAAISLCLHELAAEYGEACREKAIVLRVVPTSLWTSTDPVLFKRMLRNLLDNAVRNTPAGKILLGCRRRSGFAEVQVIDTGSGIPPEEQKAIFGEFHQVAGTKRERPQGLGMGLAIVQRLSVRLGHMVAVRSVPGRGSLFSIRVPVVEPPADEIPEAQGADPAPPAECAILVLENDPDVRAALETTLSGWGYEPLISETVEQALAHAAGSNGKIACILADYWLAGPDTGAGAIGRLREAIGRRCPAYLITGDTSRDRLDEARADGYPVLHKPLAPAELKAALARAVAEYQAQPAAS